MSKFLKTLNAIKLILKQPSLLNLILESESHFKSKVISKYGLNNGLPTIDLLELFPEFNETVNPYSFLDGTSFITDIALLRQLAIKFNAKNYFEIGTWRGESVANVASIVENCFTLNISDVEMRKSGLNEDYIKLHRFFSDKLSNVTHLFGNSKDFNFSPYFGKMDLVFVDGNHHYDAVKNDTNIAFNLIKSKDSIIVWHDYSSDTVDIRWVVLTGILDACPSDKRGKIYHVSNTLCAIYYPYPVKSEYLSPFPKPNKIFNIDISAKKLI